MKTITIYDNDGLTYSIASTDETIRDDIDILNCDKDIIGWIIE